MRAHVNGSNGDSVTGEVPPFSSEVMRRRLSQQTRTDPLVCGNHVENDSLKVKIQVKKVKIR